MSSANFLRLFGELRLSPWLPEHDRYIRSRIAALGVEDPKEAVHKADQYAKIHAEYLKAHPQEAITPMPPELVEMIEKKEGKVEPKKRGPKPKVK